MIPDFSARDRALMEETLRWLLRADRSGFISSASIKGLSEEVAEKFGCEFRIAESLVIGLTAKVAMAMLEEGWD
jgi:phosphoserine phosphatase